AVRDDVDEENDLLAALDADHAAPPPPVDDRSVLRHADGFDGFPALANDDDDGPGFFGVATSVNAGADVVASAPPTAAVMPPPRASVPQPSLPSASPLATATRPVARARQAFDDYVTGAVANPTANPTATASAGTDDDFDDGKTRALVVDEGLLARLKLGDAQPETPAPPAPPAATAPSIVDAPFASDEADDDADDEADDDHVVAGVDDGDEATQTPIGASAEDEGDTPSSREATAMAAPQPGSREPRAADELASLLDDDPLALPDDDDGFDGGAAAADFGDDDDDDGADAGLLAALVGRERALLAELERVRLEIEQTRSRIDVTDHGRIARRSQLPTQMPLTKRPTEPSSPVPAASSVSSSSARSGSGPVVRAASTNVGAAVAADPFAVVGASADHSAEAETSTLASPAPPLSSSLVSLQSIDVQEIVAPAEPRRSGLLDAFDDDDDDDDDDGIDDSDSGSNPAAPIGVRNNEHDGFDDGFSGFDDAPANRGNDLDVGGDDDDGVSLADLQGALQELGVDLADADPGHTQVAAAAMPFALPADADDGDVFGSGSGSSQVQRPAVSELSHEETRVRQARPASIGIVVEDERARLRLRKHLVDKFADLVEAASTEDVADLDAVEALDAIVIVRPTDDDATRDGFARLNALPRRPRVLVISGDEQYDDHDAVDLRLPLGQKASEVAKQVLDGLERLGIQATSGL
ncbi:MAG TPA: hypothetical protein VGF99_09110, partial [Myxococcota bacterium]